VGREEQVLPSIEHFFITVKNRSLNQLQSGECCFNFQKQLFLFLHLNLIFIFSFEFVLAHLEPYDQLLARCRLMNRTDDGTATLRQLLQ
jgi:hypothetical protein